MKENRKKEKAGSDPNPTVIKAQEGVDYLRRTLIRVLVKSMEESPKTNSDVRSWAELCRRCEMDYSHFKRYVKGPRWRTHFPTEDIFRLIAAADLEPEDLFWEAYEPFFRKKMHQQLQKAEASGFGPASRLRLARSKGLPDEDEHFLFLKFMLGQDLPLARLPANYSIALDSRVAKIDDLREKDRHKALEEATCWLQECDDRLSEGERSEETVARFCMALGAWSSTQRYFGRTQLAGLALEGALRIHGSTPLSPSYADLCVRAAHIIRDLGQPALGLPLIVAASPVFQLRRDSRNHGRALLGIGVIANYAGEIEIAKAALKDCYGLSGISNHIRLCAKFNLAYIQVQCGLCQEADAVLESVLECKLPQRTYAQVIWRRACAQSEISHVFARDLFEEALPLALEYLEPLDPFLVFRDYCDLLNKLEDHKTIARHALVLLPQLKRLETQNPVTQGAAASFLAAAQDSFQNSDYASVSQSLLKSVL